MPKDVPNCPCSHLELFTPNQDGIYDIVTAGHEVMYYCPNCKGRIPNFWKFRISDEERDGLQDMIENVNSREDAIEKLGPPDYDSFTYHCIDSKSVLPEESQQTRNIEYYGLSEHAALEFYFSAKYPPMKRITLKPTEADLAKWREQS